MSEKTKTSGSPGRAWTFVAVASGVVAILLITGWLSAPSIVALDIGDGGKASQSVRLTAIAEVRQSFLWIAGGLIAVVTLTFTYLRDRVARERVDLDRDANFTTRYTEAIAQLGNEDSLAIRLGGVYALERVADQSLRDRQTILDVLAAFLRAKSPAPPLGNFIPIPADVNAAVLALGRISQMSKPSNSLDLRGANLGQANLAKANLSGANLREASFFGVNLAGANLQNARMLRTDFREADLRGASFAHATIQYDTSFLSADLAGADFSYARFDGEIDFYKANEDKSTNWTGSGRGGQPVSTPPAVSVPRWHLIARKIPGLGKRFAG